MKNPNSVILQIMAPGLLAITLASCKPSHPPADPWTADLTQYLEDISSTPSETKPSNRTLNEAAAFSAAIQAKIKTDPRYKQGILDSFNNEKTLEKSRTSFFCFRILSPYRISPRSASNSQNLISLYR